jgi:anti-sigma B factor antagonist
MNDMKKGSAMGPGSRINERVSFEHVAPHVIAVRGEVDVLTSAFLRQELIGLASPPLAAQLVDLRGVTFMDATGLGVLVGAQKRAAASGAELLLVMDQPFLDRLFRITGLDRAFRVFATIDDAEASLVPLAS